MNQDQVKDILLKLRDDLPEFSLIFSGKKSKKVYGLYKPDTREIIIHNKNHKTDNELVHTAIHEYAHHIQFTENPMQKSAKSHNSVFYNIFHRLLALAEEKGLYQNQFKTDPDLIELTRNLKENYLLKHGTLMIDFGKMLLKAMSLCAEKGLSFDDYLTRELFLNKSDAVSMIRISAAKLDPRIGYDNMITLSKVKDGEKREELEQSLLENRFTHPMVLEEVKKKPEQTDPVKLLLQEKQRIENTIRRLETDLKKISEKIEDIQSTTGNDVY